MELYLVLGTGKFYQPFTSFWGHKSSPLGSAQGRHLCPALSPNLHITTRVTITPPEIIFDLGAPQRGPPCSRTCPYNNHRHQSHLRNITAPNLSKYKVAIMHHAKFWIDVMNTTFQNCKGKPHFFWTRVCCTTMLQCFHFVIDWYQHLHVIWGTLHWYIFILLEGFTHWIWLNRHGRAAPGFRCKWT